MEPYAAGVVVFPDGHQVIGLTRDQMDPFIQQSISPRKPAPSLDAQTFESSIIPYFAQDVLFTL